MDILDNKSNEDLLKSLLAEAAKASNELRCAQSDLNKISSRLNFTLMLINELIIREQ